MLLKNYFFQLHLYQLKYKSALLNFKDKSENIFYNINKLGVISNTPYKLSIYKNNMSNSDNNINN